MNKALSALAAVMMVLALATSIVWAQSPIDGAHAVATQAMLTAQAQLWRQAQMSTAQAQAVEGTRQAQAAIATRQAVEARVTQDALDALAQERAVEGTRQAINITETAQAVDALGTRTAQDAQATRAAHTAYQAAWERAERQGQAIEWFLYLALALTLVGALSLVFRAYQAIQAIEQRAERQAVPLPPAGVVIDAVVDYQEPGRGLSVTVIDNPDLVDRFEQYVMEHGI